MSRRSIASERGQSTVEWLGLVLGVSGLVAAVATTAGAALPGGTLARAVAARIVCAIELADSCDSDRPGGLARVYGAELAATLAAEAPQIRYEPGMNALPIDYRRCREDSCANGAAGIRVARTLTGERATLFTRVIDCRPGSLTPGADCSGRPAGSLYLQYWLYYPGSATGEGSTPLRGAIREVSAALGKPSYHPDDWESFQLRIRPGGAAHARASSHHGYGPGWVPARDAHYRVAGGSHAGTVGPAGFDRITNPRHLRLIALEPIAGHRREPEFAVTPPWRKRVWSEPEYEGTD